MLRITSSACILQVAILANLDPAKPQSTMLLGDGLVIWRDSCKAWR